MLTNYSDRRDFGFVHLLIAFALFPCYFFFGIEFKLLMIPYVVYMVLSQQSGYYPAIVLHFLPGSTVSFVILVCTCVIAFLEINRLGDARIQRIYLLACLSLPLLAFVAIQRIATTGESFADVLQDFSLYFGLFPFFYGVIIGRMCEEKDLVRVIWALIFVFFIQISGVFNTNIRAVGFAVPIFLTILGVRCLGYRVSSLSFYIQLFPIVVLAALAMELIGLSFILVLSTAVAIAFVMISRVPIETRRSIPIRSAMVVSALFGTTYIIQFAGYRVTDSPEIKGIEEISSISDVLPAIEFKAFADRGPLWSSAWNSIVREATVFPPTEPIVISFDFASRKSTDLTYGAHNVGLELLRSYGYFVGIIGIIVYLGILGSLATFLCSENLTPTITLFGSCVLATALVGGVLGHYVLIDNFSFLLFSLGGIVFARSNVCNNEVV